MFCDIVADKVRAAIVEQTDSTVAFADLRQPSWPSGGHVLVVPRRHVETVYDLTPPDGDQLMRAVVRVARAMRERFEPDGLSVWQSNGPAANQEVPHVHMHVLARSTGDGLLRVYPEKPGYPSTDELTELATKLRASKEIR